MVDADWFARAERYRRAHPSLLAAAGDVTRVGEVLVLQPTDEMVMSTGGQSFALGSLQAITARVIAFAGDNFHTITLWTSFPDDSNEALAYALNVRNEVTGLGAKLEVRDLSKTFGSAGMLRTVVNMKEIGLRATDNRDSWDSALEIWGQEVGHLAISCSVGIVRTFTASSTRRLRYKMVFRGSTTTTVPSRRARTTSATATSISTDLG